MDSWTRFMHGQHGGMPARQELISRIARHRDEAFSATTAAWDAWASGGYVHPRPDALKRAGHRYQLYNRLYERALRGG